MKLGPELDPSSRSHWRRWSCAVEIPQLQDVKVCLGTKANTEKNTLSFGFSSSNGWGLNHDITVGVLHDSQSEIRRAEHFGDCPFSITYHLLFLIQSIHFCMLANFKAFLSSRSLSD